MYFMEYYILFMAPRIKMIVIKTYFVAVVTGQNVASFHNNRSKVSFNYYQL